MAKRESVYVIKRIPTSGTDPEADEYYKDQPVPNPNVYVGEITVEFRMFFPPHTPYGEIIGAYDTAMDEFWETLLEDKLKPLVKQRLSRMYQRHTKGEVEDD